MIIRKYRLFVLLLILSCGDKSEEDKNDDSSKGLGYLQNKIDVEIQIIQRHVFNKQILSNGTVEAKQKTDLRFKTSDRLTSVRVMNGQEVTNDQVLATLDNELLANRIDKEVIDFANAKNKLKEEKINYGLGHIENHDLEPHILKNLQIKSGYFEAQNALENAQLLHKQTILRAPFNGVIANLESKTGNYVTSSDIFCTIINPNQMEASFSVMESELPFVQKGQKAIIIPFANESKIYTGEITELNPMIDKSGLVKLKAKINNPDASLFDGMNVRIIINQALDNVMIVPKEALVLRSNKEVVFTVENGLAKWNYVHIQDENSTSYAISEGLKIGDSVIVSNNMILAHDAKVNATLISSNEEGN